MVAMAADFLATLSPEEAAAAARLMAGTLAPHPPQKPFKVGAQSLWRVVSKIAGAEDQAEEIFAAAADLAEAIEIAMQRRDSQPLAELTLAEVGRAFEEIAAVDYPSSRGQKLKLLGRLFARMTALEAGCAAEMLTGRTQSRIGVEFAAQAIAQAAGRPLEELRQALSAGEEIGRLAYRLPTERSPASGQAAPPAKPARHPVSPAPIQTAEAAGTLVRTGAPSWPGPNAPRPIRPMLARPAADIREAFVRLAGRMALEHKLHGMRLQLHCRDGRARIFAGGQDEITGSLAELVETLSSLGHSGAVLEGELIAVSDAGRPLPSRTWMGRARRAAEPWRPPSQATLRLFVFDLLGLGDASFLERPYSERVAALLALAEAHGLATVGRCLPASLEEARAFYTEALALGYEGVVAKALDSAYKPGVRSHAWLAVRPLYTADLVIVALERRGQGRRQPPWSYHVAARDDRGSGFAVVGKSFKGLSADELETLTERLTALKTNEAGRTVFVRPELVVEVAFTAVEANGRYEAGLALSSPRILRLRNDKEPAEADSVATLRALCPPQQ